MREYIRPLIFVALNLIVWTILYTHNEISQTVYLVATVVPATLWIYWVILDNIEELILDLELKTGLDLSAIMDNYKTK